MLSSDAYLHFAFGNDRFWLSEPPNGLCPVVQGNK
jgi:hypothetical protein